MKKYCFIVLFISCFAETGNCKEIGPAPLRVKFAFEFNDHRSDTLNFYVYAQKLGLTTIGSVFYQVPVRNGRAVISFPLKNNLSYVHVESTQWPRLYMDNMLVEPGDNVSVRVDTTGKKLFENIQGIGLSCKGRGSVKYQVRILLDSLMEVFDKEVTAAGPPRFLEKMGSEDKWNYYNTAGLGIRDKRLELLRSFEHKIPALVYATMRADLYYGNLESTLVGWSIEQENLERSPDSAALLAKFRDIFQQRFGHEAERQLTTEKGRLSSWTYLQFLIRKTRLTARMKAPANIRFLPEASDYLPSLKQVGRAQFDRLATGFIADVVTHNLPIAHTQRLLTEVLGQSSNAEYKAILEEIQQRIFVTDTLRHFSLTNFDGKKVTLQDLRGKTVLFDFWFTNCLPCMQVSEKLKELDKLLIGDTSVVVVSVCMDKDMARWKASVATGKYTSPDHFNLYTSGLGHLHPFLQYYRITSVPRLLLVDSQGRLRDANFPIPWYKEEIEQLAGRMKSMR